MPVQCSQISWKNRIKKAELAGQNRIKKGSGESTRIPTPIPRAFFDGAAQLGTCACGVYIIPEAGQAYEIYWNGGPGSNNRAEVMALANVLSFWIYRMYKSMEIRK